LLPSTLWQVGVAELLSSRRSTFIKVIFPTVVGGLYLFVAPSGFFTASLITVLAAVTGCFGTGITLSRARSEGVLQRITLTPLSRRRIVLEQLAINSAVDFCQMLPLALLTSMKFEAYDLRLLTLLLALGVALVAANLLGLLMIILATTVGEAMLYSSLALFPLLYIGGVFTPVGLEGTRAILSSTVPFSCLQQALLAVIGESPAWPALRVVETSVVAGAGMLLVAALVGPRVLRFEP